VNRAALLDVNVLVALFDADHVHHDLAHDWFADNRSEGWATCAVTENGLIRILANPRYGSPVAGIPLMVERLRKFRASGGHQFWSDDVSLADTSIFAPAPIKGHRQITDVYLLGLAVKKRGRLATFDRTIPLSAVSGATRTVLEILGPADVE
jgi:toxin-antitoxin system PIN domain toxin